MFEPGVYPQICTVTDAAVEKTPALAAQPVLLRPQLQLQLCVTLEMVLLR